ncbi:MAG: porin family protein [Burkholderiales bacterium]
MTALASLAASSALAQQTTTDTGLRLPYQKEFWTTGHAGVQIGRSKLDVDCPAGASCDDKSNAFKVFAGGRFNNIFGGEVSYLNTGDFDRSGAGTNGSINTQALNFGLLAGVPFGPNRNSSIFGKLGVLWGHTEAGNLSQNGWGGSYGLGATIGVTRSWAVRLDWDRYRIKLPTGGGDRENVDSFLIGAQYTFGNPR